MPRENSAGAIIFRLVGGVPYYLLLHYHSGHWEFARGHVEKGEEEIKTVLREVEEETGIKDLKIIPDFKGHTKFFFKRVYGLTGEARKRAPWVMKIVALYLAKTETEQVRISDEHKGFGWFSYDEALKKLAKDAKKVFRDANEFLIQRKSV